MYVYYELLHKVGQEFADRQEFNGYNLMTSTADVELELRDSIFKGSRRAAVSNCHWGD